MAANIDLGDLADPSFHTDMIGLDNRPDAELLADLECMILIRKVEEAIADLALSGESKCPCHLCIGQEAVAVGFARAFTSDDRLYGGHRSHSQYIALGGSVDALMAEILGKEAGCSKGMGGSMHLYAEDVGFGGCVPIVAGTVPIAVGAALAFRTRDEPHVAAAFFGDGACEEGVVHESMNFSSIMKLPMIFVVENNLFSSHLDIHLRQPGNRVSRFAEAHDIAVEVVDGNDVCAMRAAAERLCDRARAGEGPGFIEAVTYRWRGHVGPDENIDVGVRRSLDEIAAWKKRDPVARLEQALRESRGIESGFDEIRARVDGIVESAVAKARAADYPTEAALLDRVYAS